MKNKKGFTLVELLSVIVLLGIIITIGLFSISSIRKTILDRQYKNLKTEIELAAEKYYQDTESTIFYVQTLLDEGYIKADNSSLNIYSPVDSNIMNCYTINVVDEKATLDDINKNKECNAEIAGNYELKIVRENNKTSDKWYKESEELSAVKSDNSVDDSLIYTWTTDLNPNTIWDKRKFDLKNLLSEKGGVINDVFYVQANSQDTDKVYRSAGKRIKIDTVKPIIDNVNISGDQNEWVKQRDVTIKAHDLGAGIVGYLFSDKADCSGNFEKLTKPQNEFTLKRTFKSNGEYYFCLIDDAGNISESSKIVIQKVDGIPPKCYYSGESTEYIKGIRVITYGCIDDESGCATLKVGSATSTCDPSTSTNCSKLTNTYSYKDTTITDKITNKIGSFTIIDKNGNKTDCPIVDKTNENYKENLNIYLDNTKPTIRINSMSYSNGYLNVNVSLSDNESGANVAYITFKGNTSSTVSCKGTCNVSLYIGSITSGTVYAYGKDVVGNINNATKNINNYSSYNEGERGSSSSFSQNLSISGTTLYYNASASVGSVSCYSSGSCTVTPETTTTSCTLEESPNTTEAYYDDCEDGGYLNGRGMCDARDQDYTNDSGYCYFSNGNYSGDDFDFRYQCDCSCTFGNRWYDGYVEYCCNDCSQYVSCSNSGNVCYNIAGVRNFGNYTGYKGITAYKTCYYDSYEPYSYCPYGYEQSGSDCYSCDRGYLNYRNLCVYTGTCTTYRYYYSYNYYTYN